jgi:mRNA interferase MazF
LVTRGVVLWLELELEGRRPVCVLTRDEAIPNLRNILVALVTGRKRGLTSEVTIGPDDGMPQECVVTLDNLRTIPKAQLVEPITKLGAERMDEVCRALNSAAGC